MIRWMPTRRAQARRGVTGLIGLALLLTALLAAIAF